MRIGDVAALTGVSTRTVRYYHRVGLLPEPDRRPNGYRQYRVVDAVRLARVRRLAELGLSLAEISDLLADGDGDLRTALRGLDDDLARQERELALRRARLAELLARDDLDADTTVSPEVAAALRAMPSGTSRLAALDRDLLSLLDLSLVESGAELGSRGALRELLGPLAEPDVVERGLALYRRLDELADARPDDARIQGLGDELAAHLEAWRPTPAGADTGADTGTGGLGPVSGGDRWLEAVAGEVSAAQFAVLRRAWALLGGAGPA